MNTRLRQCLHRFPVATLLAASTAGLPGCGTDYASLGGGDTFGRGLTTLSFFRAIQVDPRSEDSAGPQFVEAADLNGDGLVDLVSAWNQSQPVQIHLQSRSGSTITFETVTLAGAIPVLNVAGLAVNDFDGDGRADIAVLVKESLASAAGCLNSEQPDKGLSGLILVYFGPANPTLANRALAWDEVPISSAFLQGAGDAGGLPEFGGFTSMQIGDMDVDGDTDIVVTWNSSCGDGMNDVVVFRNNGSGPTRDGNWTALRIPDGSPKDSAVKDIALADIDLDGDLDVIATFPHAATMNVRWYRNPAVDVPDDFHYSNGAWQTGFIGQLATGADTLSAGDIDGDGIPDVAVRSAEGGIVQWYRAPAGPTTTPLRSIPWQVYTISEFTDRTPAAITLGDLNADGQLELIASAGGALVVFDALAAGSVYDPWGAKLIIDDDASGPPGTTSGGTVINSVVVVDLDGDGRNDVLATLDRAGLTRDVLIWFRNIGSN